MGGHESERLHYTRTCEMCGAVMQSVAPNKRLCPACVKQNQHQRDQKKALATAPLHREAYARREGPKKVLAANDSIGAVCARAIAAGRTYGQQVEFERRQKELKDRGEIDKK